MNETETHLRAIFENSSNGFLLLDKNWNIIEFNSIWNDYGRSSLNEELQKNKNFVHQNYLASL